MATITDTPVNQGTGPFLLQNLGPDDAYVGGANVDDESGIKIAAGEAVSVGYSNGNGFFVVSSGTSDVRKLSGVQGIFSVNVAPPETP